MKNLIKFILIINAILFVTRSHSQKLTNLEIAKMTEECNIKTDKNIEILRSFGNYEAKYAVEFLKCMKHSKIIFDFKRSNTTKDLLELYNLTLHNLRIKIFQLYDLINITYDERKSNEFIRQMNCYKLQLLMLNLSKDENLMILKRNIDIFQYQEGGFLKNALIYANSSLKDNCILQ